MIAHFFGVEFAGMDAFQNLDALILAVAHDEFKRLPKDTFDKMFKGKKVLIDIKGILNRQEYEDNGYLYWRL